MKKTLKTMFVSLLCFSMVAGYSLPAFANEENNNINEQTIQETNETQEQPMVEDVQQGQTTEEPKTQDLEEQLEPVTPMQEEVADSVVPAPIQVDTTDPVLEKLELKENGQTVDGGSTITVVAELYDADSEISEVTAFFSLTNDSYATFETVYLNHVSGKTYEGQLMVPEYGITRIELNTFTIRDTQNNEFQEDYSEKYFVNVIPKELGEITPKITKIEFDGNHKEFKQRDETRLRVYFENMDFITQVYANFETESGVGLGYFDSEINENYHEDYMYFSGSYGLSKGKHKFTLKSITVWTVDNQNIKLSVEDFEPVDFTLVIEDDQKPKIQSIKMTHNQEAVKPGDKIDIKIKATDNGELEESATAYFNSVEDYNNHLYVYLVWNEAEKAYVGSLEIMDTYYPTEYVLSEVNVNDNLGNLADTHSLFGDGTSMNDYYFMVNKDGAFVNPTYDCVTLSFTNPFNNSQVIKTQTKNNIKRRTTFKEAGFDLNVAVEPPVEGVEFVGWYSSDLGKVITEDAQIAPKYAHEGEVFYNLTPKFDKNIIRLNLEYLNTSGNISNEVIVLTIEHGMTYGELGEYINSGVIEISDVDSKVNGWNIDSNIDGTAIVGINEYLYVDSVVQDKVIAQIALSYLNQDGQLSWITETKLYDKDLTFEELHEKARQKNIADDYYKGLNFTGWNIYDERKGPVDSDVVRVAGEAQSSNHYVRYVIDPRVADDYPGAGRAVGGGSGFDIGETEDYEYSYVELYDHGAIAKPPKKFGNYNKVLFMFGMGGASGFQELPEGYEFKVDYDRTFYGYSPDETPVEPEKPADKTALLQLIEEAKKLDEQKYTEASWSKFVEAYNHANKVFANEKATQIEINEAMDKLTFAMSSLEIKGVTLPEEKVDQVVEEIGKAEEGSNIKVPMNDATVVPEKILEEVKGKDVDVTLDMGDYTWTINGNDVLANDLKDINLEVTFDTNAIPDKVVSQIAGDKPVKQLSLTHEGNFGFKGTLTFYMGKEYAGKQGALYYYDSDGKMILQNTSVIDEDGYASFTFSHASDYMVVIEEKGTVVDPENPTDPQNPVVPENQGQSNKPSENNSNGSNESDKPESEKDKTNTATQNNSSAYKGLLVASVMAGLVLVLTRMRKRSH